jgi:sarcosine oxidase subunit beta
MADPSQEPGFGAPIPDGWDERVADVAARRLPVLLDAGIAGGWSGYYEVTPDDNALLGEAAHVSRFLYATGFSGHGFLQGPAVGEIVRDLVLGRQPFVDVTPLSVDRFAAGETRRERNVV